MKTKNKITREDIAMVLELMSIGIKISFIAHYVYGLTYWGLRHHLKKWGAI
jgi:hypothetical protein